MPNETPSIRQGTVVKDNFARCVLVGIKSQYVFVHTLPLQLAECVDLISHVYSGKYQPPFSAYLSHFEESISQLF